MSKSPQYLPGTSRRRVAHGCFGKSILSRTRRAIGVRIQMPSAIAIRCPRNSLTGSWIGQ
jgi:hypothetical protein